MRVKQKFVMFCAVLVGGIAACSATTLDTVGVTLLRAVEPELIGSGVNVAQPEAAFSEAFWQVNPFAVGQPTNLFTYISSDGSASNYPNSVGGESGHANGVGAAFFGTATGVAPGVAHVDNYEANHFYQSNIVTGIPIQAKIVNQSFIFGEDPAVDFQYDNFAALNNTLFVSGVGNSGPPNAAATAYNGIGVGAFGGGSSVGPTTDNGRSKPDITAPADATSFSTPLVAGAAAILRQAGLRGDGGAGTTNSATDIRTLKALLLNGAVKPSTWTHTTSAPLDTRFGAGILNAFNSWNQLSGGKYSFIESTGNSSGGSHFPGNNTNNMASLVGWDFNSISSSVPQDRVNHYYFNLPGSAVKAFTLTATLAWNRQALQMNINNLDLFLYDTRNNNLIASSVSGVDNVEHLFLASLPAGRYDLQVLKRGGIGKVSDNETYALAFEIFALPLSITKSGTNVVITWPLAPAGFTLQSAPNLNPPISWTAITSVPVVTNNQNRVTIGATAATQFFRLIRP